MSHHLPLLALTLAVGSVAAMAQGFSPQLTAFELSSDQALPGGTVSASYEFVNRGDAPAENEYIVFVHIRSAAGPGLDAPPVAGADFPPTTPAFSWMPDGIVTEGGHPIRIPDDFPPGKYNVLIGLYDQGTGERLKLANEQIATPDGRYLLGQINVMPAGTQPAGKPLSTRFQDTSDLRPNDALLVPDTGGESIRLANDKLSVELSATHPLVRGYTLADGSHLLSDLSGYPLRVRFGREGEDGARTVCLRRPDCFTPSFTATEARYATRVTDGDHPVGSFDIVLSLQDDTLHAGLENVREEPGYLLYDVWLPQLAAASAPAGQLVLPTQAGRLVPLSRSSAGRHVVGMNWFEGDLCGAVVGDGCSAAMRTRDWDNELDVMVAERGGQMTGGYAVRLALRAQATTKAARILLAQAPSVDVILTPAGEDGASWLDTAKRLRREVTGTPNPIYADTIIYKIFCDSPGSNDFTTFDEALGVIRRVHDLAPWLKQIVYLVGWQYEGHDTGYPATDKINERLGGLEGLRRASAEAEKLNAVLSYHDNFDDAYLESPQWDERTIARDTHGELQKGGVWAGGQSYIMAFSKYAKGPALQRIQRTVSQMPVSESYHIDVLSAVAMRRDYNIEAPESTKESLDGKLAIVREFNRHGIDVTSEGFGAPFVGVIGHSWHFWAQPGAVIPGDEAIPFVPMIYHGGPTTYGHGGGGPTYPQETNLLGATYSSDWTKHTESHFMAEMIYLIVAPWTYLRERKIEGYEATGTVRKLIYDEDTFVEVQEGEGKWRVVVDGKTLIEDDVATIRRPGLLAAFSKPGGTVRVELPEGLRGVALQARNALTGEKTLLKATDGAVTLELVAREPCLVTRVGE